MKNSDILRHADGKETAVEDNVGLPTSPVGAEENKNFIVKATDKVGITTQGRLTRTFFWGLILGAGVVLAVGMWKDKISINYTK